MPKPARQTARTIGGGNQQKKAKFVFAPESILFGLFFIWLIVCVQFYRHGTDQPQRQQPLALDSAPNRIIQSSGVISDNSQPNNNNDDDTFPEHYLTFSTACSSSQDWQSFLVFYYAHKVQQPGHVIRIASNCSDKQKEALIKLHENVISKLSPKFSIHFTPDFARISGDNYKYYNKPFGLQHWLKYGLKYEENKEKLEDAIIMILDPDMILLRPLTYDFTDSNVIIHRSKRGPPKVRKVMHGQPWASIYAFGDGPFRVDLKHVFANHTKSPALRATHEEQENNYPGGPPYMATGRDMNAIVNAWCELVTRVHDVYEHLLGEMYGWSLAAAHLDLPHTLAESFMISATHIGDGEGWPLIDALKDDELCEYSTMKEKEDKLPYVMHYCQNYWLGKWFLGKYRLDSDFLSCEKPLLLEPPKDIGKQYDFFIKPGGNPYGKKEKLSKSYVKREQFMICQMIARLNDAATWYKSQTCEEGTANLEKSFIFHHSLDPDNNEGGEKKAKW
mmetsp:Transcript_26554/g.57267  ORF Transcript_26554/g.57267 Transcript_26554/m.57267 type:complete len:504 (+) Transcript_26554:89-1600(+)